MSKIQVLPEVVANQIAAGEVVERPASIVKELIENSIDAGAGKIFVEVRGGGRSLIRVIDDGNGMSREDAALCFQRHATSKLQDSKDLLSIRTLGFRGEALPSIASVSRVRLETQLRDTPVGTAVEVAAGEVLSIKEDAFPEGTQITIEDVFYNVPARSKFLKSESYELSRITSLCTHFALAFPGIHFVLKSGNFEILSAPTATGYRDRIFQVFGQDLLDELVEYQKDCGPGLKIHLFTSRPHVQKYNRNSMFFFVNRRVVKDKIISHAFSEAYRSILPSGTFPVAMLFVEARPKDVDVNVHPAKTEVRFRQGSLIHDAIRNTVADALTSDKTIVPMEEGAAGSSPYRAPEFKPRVPASWSGGPLAKEPIADSPAALTYSEGRVLDFDFQQGQTVTGGDAAPGTGSPRDFELVRSEIRPLGQLQDSFIIAADSSGLVVIDQHVAHERVLFEAYIRERADEQVQVQQLLMPILIELSPAQEVLIEALKPELDRNGFEVEPFGGRTLAVKTAPAILKAGAVGKLVRELLDGLEREHQGLSIDHFRKKIAATVACHAAIKINNPLDSVKMRWLVTELMKTDVPTVCPHGRPIIVRYDLREIYKAFKRS